MNDTVKITVWVATNKVGSKCELELEVDRDGWESMTEDERDDAAREAVWEMAEWGWHES